MVFLDISKAFDKVWHKGLLYKLESLGVRGSLLKWFVNGQTSSWCTIEAGVPQDSVLGPLCFS